MTPSQINNCLHNIIEEITSNPLVKEMSLFSIWEILKVEIENEARSSMMPTNQSKVDVLFKNNALRWFFFECIESGNVERILHMYPMFQYHLGDSRSVDWQIVKENLLHYELA